MATRMKGFSTGRYKENRERERERDCVCVYERERERERDEPKKEAGENVASAGNLGLGRHSFCHEQKVHVVIYLMYSF